MLAADQRLKREELFVPQGDHGVDADGLARGDVAGGEGDECEQDDDGSKGKRICGGHAEEQAG